MAETVYSGKYAVQELIAQGGMGVVYKALDQKLNRIVALKVVHTHLCRDPGFLERFLREARAMARLQHENIVTIYSVEQDQDTQYLVMEYFPGTNLRDSLRASGALPIREAVNITRQIAQALAYAHTHGIIHRDIKPANVLLDAKNRAKLTDFGIAAALDDAPLTSTGQLIGTLPYMSPEQARDAILDGRSDLYSLGLVFYELLTGSNPRHNLSSAAILGMLISEHNMPAVELPSSIPVEIQRVVGDLLHYRPTDRIQDAETLVARLEDLRPLWAGATTVARAHDPAATIVVPAASKQPPPPLLDQPTIAVLTPSGATPSPQPQQPPLDDRKVLYAGIGILALLLVGSGIYFYPWQDAPRNTQESATTGTSDTSQRNSATPEMDTAARARPADIPTAPNSLGADKPVPEDPAVKRAAQEREAAEKAAADQATAMKVAQEKVASEKAAAERAAAQKAAAEKLAAEQTAAAKVAIERAAAAKAAADRAAADKAVADKLAAARAAAEKAAADKAAAAKTAADQAQAKAAAEKAALERAALERARAEEAAAAEKTAAARAAAEKTAAEKAATERAAAERAAAAKAAAEKAAADKAAAEQAAAEQAAAAKAAAERAAQEKAAAEKAAAERVAAERLATEQAAAKAAAEKAAAEKAAAERQAAEQAAAAKAAAEKAAAQKAAAEKAAAEKAAAEKAATERLAAEQTAAKAAAEKAAADKAALVAAAEKAAIDKAVAERAAQQKAALQKSLMDKLEQFATLVATKDLEGLKKLSIINESRMGMLTALYENYPGLEVSIGEVTDTPSGATALLLITKLIRPNGDVVTPTPIVRKTKLLIPREGDEWGKIRW